MCSSSSSECIVHAYIFIVHCDVYVYMSHLSHVCTYDVCTYDVCMYG